MTSSGKLALESIIRQLGERAQQGEPVAVLWDMDGTLVDTRPRMLASVHTYGRTDVRITEVSPSWQETAARLQLDSDRFQAVWQRVFWAYESFDADIENEEVAALAKLAESLGIQTIIVTGRIEELRPVTTRQLERLGLKPSRVFLKSEVGDCTPTTKAEVISQLAEEGLRMGAFVTDSPEELAAVNPEILAAAPGLARIFVQLEGTEPSLPEGVHRFEVPFYNGVQMEEFSPVLSTQHGNLNFGFEAEYEIESADLLLQLYDPGPQAEFSPEQWQNWSPRERADWVRGQFPDPHSEEFDLPLARNQKAPELDFLPPGLFVDSDGNIEVVSEPTEDLSQLWQQIERLERQCGPPLLQVTVSVPSNTILGREGGLEALDGFLSFYHFRDIFERMSVGHTRYRENPDQEVLLPFLHPWLGPMTRGKHRFLRQYLEANAKGERLDEKWVRLVDRAFSSFKYITGSAYRPALAGPDRIAIEIRDAHRNKVLLAQRVTRTAESLLSGLEAYAPFARTRAFDSEADYDGLPLEVRRMLERAIPTRVRPEIDYMYSEYDRVALQVYRNFALPMKDYSDLDVALGDQADPGQWKNARRNYLETLQQLGSEATRQELQGALCAFAEASGLHQRLVAFEEFCRQRTHKTRDRVQSLLPLLHALPRTAWSGPLTQRLERLRKRWPQQVSWCPTATFESPRLKETSRPHLVVSTKGLSLTEIDRLRTDYLEAVSRQTLGVRVTDRGSLELRFGSKVYQPGRWATDDLDYEPFLVGVGVEPILELSQWESYHVGRQLAAHRPCDEAARRVSASGWLRHLSFGDGQNLEQSLGLPSPESIETAAQVLDRILEHASPARLSCVVQWTTGSLQESGSRVTLEPSRLSSGFPPSLQTGPAIGGRLEALVSRWPDHTRLVEQVPFSFGKGSKERTVLVIALAKMDDDKFEKFRQDYLDTIGFDTVSFPCRLRAEHLRARVGTLALALSAEGVRVDFYAPPWRRRRMEALIELQPPEVLRLRRYLGAVVDNTLGMLGPITLGAGCRTSARRPDNNHPTDGGQHNCTTWVTLAPIGEDGADLANLVEMPESWTSHDNPGWWTMFLTGASRSKRVHTVIYWSDLPLDEEPCTSGQAIPWDFNPH